MNKALVAHAAGQQLVQYSEMCRLVARCHSFDECKDIIDKSVAMAAYYAQIKDTETEIMFHRVRVRAWRRIAEMFRAVDLSDIPPSDSWQARGTVTMSSKVKKIRAAFDGDPTVADMSDSRIGEILKLMVLTDADFEHAVNQNIGGSLIDLLRRTPEAEAAFEEGRKEQAEFAKNFEKQQRENKKEAEAAFAADIVRRRHEDELDREAEAAMKEIGITLERKDRANMKQVVFLIKEEVHAVMRQAAFDRRVTMQEVLRRGLKLWLEANGYDFPDDPPVRRAATRETHAT